MKQSHRCPKCHGNRLLHLTQIADAVGDWDGGRIDDGLESGIEPNRAAPWRLTGNIDNPVLRRLAAQRLRQQLK